MREDLRNRLGDILHFDWGQDSEYGIPEILPDPEVTLGTALIGFNYSQSTAHYDRTLHFFLNDYLFERVWNQPSRYFRELARYHSVITPNFSMYSDYPKAFLLYNVWRQRVLGRWWQEEGVRVIPSVNWADERSYEYCFIGIPENVPLAITNLGAVQNVETRKLWLKGYEEMLKRLSPSKVWIYGHNHHVGEDVAKLGGNVVWLEYEWREGRKEIIPV